jgi:hypothetical protein
LTFSAAVTFDEQAATTLIDAGVTRGVTRIDNDDSGVAGPHHLELDAVTITTAATEGAKEVELGLGLEQVSLLLGDFLMPDDCLGPTLVGFSTRFPVEPPE